MMRPDLKKGVPAAIKGYIDQAVRFTALPTIQQLSDTFGYHPDTLSRRFKKKFGVSLKEYIIGKKMQEGYRLLTEEDRSVGYVSTRLGYNSGSSFSTQFRHFFGRSPRELQRMDTKKEPT